MPERRHARHDLMWLSPAAVTSARPLLVEPGAVEAARAVLADWVGADRPLVVARQPRELPPGRMLLGLPVPASRGKQRLAFDVARAQVTRCAPPPPLAAIAAHLPPAWQPRIEALLADPAIAAANPRAYGSAAMQALTGLDCLGEQSDLDLLLTPQSREAALAVMAALDSLDRAGKGPRLDGELVDRRGRATSWRELLRGTHHVLVKQIDAVAMTGYDDYLAGFAGQAA